MFVRAAKLPFQAVDDAFDACLQDIVGNTNGSPTFFFVGENPKDANWRFRAAFLFITERAAMKQPDVEILEFHLG